MRADVDALARGGALRLAVQVRSTRSARATLDRTTVTSTRWRIVAGRGRGGLSSSARAVRVDDAVTRVEDVTTGAEMGVDVTAFVDALVARKRAWMDGRGTRADDAGGCADKYLRRRRRRGWFTMARDAGSMSCARD